MLLCHSYAIINPNLHKCLTVIFILFTETEKAPEILAGHPKLPAGGTASKCPFLAAEMGQKNSGVVREASMELQEDVSEIRTLQQGF